MMDSVATPKGYKQITTLSSAVGIGTVPPGTQLALLTAEGKNLRWRDDGTNPTTSVGMLLSVGQTISYNGPIEKLKVIEVESGGILNVSLYGR
jgi:hypothetical protein